MIPAIIAVALVIGAVIAVLVAWRRAKARVAAEETTYTPISTGNSVRYRLAPGCPTQYQPAAMEAEWLRAIGALITEGPWGEELCFSRLRGMQIRIVVQAQTSWLDPWGRTVAGVAVLDPPTLIVGADLRALCHELAELLWQGERGPGASWHDAPTHPYYACIRRACDLYETGG